MKCKKCGSTKMSKSVVGSVTKGVLAGGILWTLGGVVSSIGWAAKSSSVSAVKEGAELIAHGTKVMNEGVYKCDACGSWDIGSL